MEMKALRGEVAWTADRKGNSLCSVGPSVVSHPRLDAVGESPGQPGCSPTATSGGAWNSVFGDGSKRVRWEGLCMAGSGAHSPTEAV